MPSPVYLLDTAILLVCVRGGKLGKYICAQYPFDNAGFGSLVCVVSVGEILSLSKKLKWGSERNAILRALLDTLVTVDINSNTVLEAYSELDYFSESIGRRMGKNDIWIAAAAKATGATLLTTDNDFDHLHPTQITRVLIDPATGE